MPPSFAAFNPGGSPITLCPLNDNDGAWEVCDPPLVKGLRQARAALPSPRRLNTPAARAEAAPPLAKYRGPGG